VLSLHKEGANSSLRPQKGTAKRPVMNHNPGGAPIGAPSKHITSLHMQMEFIGGFSS
jgi:hypothetical protein